MALAGSRLSLFVQADLTLAITTKFRASHPIDPQGFRPPATRVSSAHTNLDIRTPAQTNRLAPPACMLLQVTRQSSVTYNAGPFHGPARHAGCPADGTLPDEI